MKDKCDMCVNSKDACDFCKDAPQYRNVPRISYFMAYKPTCPRGYMDCVCDPAYIKFYHEEWYHDLYGDLTPEQAIHQEGGCMERFKSDPEMNFYCYDDEDK